MERKRICMRDLEVRCQMNYGEQMELEARNGKKESVRSAEMWKKGIKEVRRERVREVTREDSQRDR